jgi:hypothetical protein
MRILDYANLMFVLSAGFFALMTYRVLQNFYSRICRIEKTLFYEEEEV